MTFLNESSSQCFTEYSCYVKTSEKQVKAHTASTIGTNFMLPEQIQLNATINESTHHHHPLPQRNHRQNPPILVPKRHPLPVIE